MSDDSAYAATPFDHPKGDIILRSSDNIDFRVFKLFLSLASPFFETLFDIPQPFQETDDPKLEVLKDAMDVLEAARKYSLDAIEKKARQAISSPTILEAEPLRCFAIAHRGHLQEETLLAARYTLTQPLVPSWFQEIELITAADLLSLLTYHRQCGDAVYALRLDLSWITSHYGSSATCSWLCGYDDNYSRNCGCSRPAPVRYKLFDMKSPQWWVNFMDETFTALRDKPCKATVQASSEKAVQKVKAGGCHICAPKITDGMRDLVDLFVRKIEETVSQIVLNLEFK